MSTSNSLWRQLFIALLNLHEKYELAAVHSTAIAVRVVSTHKKERCSAGIELGVSHSQEKGKGDGKQ